MEGEVMKKILQVLSCIAKAASQSSAVRSVAIELKHPVMGVEHFEADFDEDNPQIFEEWTPGHVMRVFDLENHGLPHGSVELEFRALCNGREICWCCIDGRQYKATIQFLPLHKRLARLWRASNFFT